MMSGVAKNSVSRINHTTIIMYALIRMVLSDAANARNGSIQAIQSRLRTISILEREVVKCTRTALWVDSAVHNSHTGRVTVGLWPCKAMPTKDTSSISSSSSSSSNNGKQSRLLQFKVRVSGTTRIVARNEQEARTELAEWFTLDGENWTIEEIQCIGEAW